MNITLHVFKLNDAAILLVFPDLYLCFELTSSASRGILQGWYMESVTLPVKKENIKREPSEVIMEGAILYNGDIENFIYKPNYFGGIEYLENFTKAIKAIYTYLENENVLVL